MAKSFLERINPSRERSKPVEWPFPTEDGAKHMLKVRVLSENDTEAAYLATQDYFKKKLKRTPDATDTAFQLREQIEIVLRAFSVEGERIATSGDELAAQPLGIIRELYNTWLQFQNDVCAVPHTTKEMDELVELLKKNMAADRLFALPSSWLIALISTLASRLHTSTPDSERG